jgi:hypothetical protein
MAELELEKQCLWTFFMKSCKETMRFSLCGTDDFFTHLIHCITDLKPGENGGHIFMILC